MLGLDTAPLEALGRLCTIAKRDTGQSRRVADFLLAWHNAAENGGWDPTDLWNVDTAVAEDILTVLKLASESRKYRRYWFGAEDRGDLAALARPNTAPRLNDGPPPGMVRTPGRHH